MSSALHVLLGVRRVHSRMGIEMVPFRLIRDSISNLTMRFVELHGHEALLPQRKAPLSFGAFQALILLPPGVYGSVHYTGLLATSAVAVMCLLWASGFRKAELVSPTYHLRLASLVWWLVLGSGPAQRVDNPTELQLKLCATWQLR